MRTANNPDGNSREERLVGMYIDNESIIRFQDFTLRVESPALPLESLYGVHLANCSDYTFARIQIILDDARSGDDGQNGADGAGGKGGAGGAGSGCRGGLYPNPTNSRLNIDLWMKIEGKISTQIVDMKDRVLFVKKMIHKAGKHTLKVSLSEFPSGIYEVMISFEGGTCVRRKIFKNNL